MRAFFTVCRNGVRRFCNNYMVGMPQLHACRRVGFPALGLVLALILSATLPAQTPPIVVVGPGEDLQRALDTAVPGSTIALEPGATYVGNFVLPVHGGRAFITVRTGTGKTPDAVPAGQRVLPTDAAALATIRSPNELPALQTAAGAHHWRLVLLEFGPNATPGNDLIRLGDGSARQSSLAAVPHELEVDRCFIHGDPHQGQKRGIALNSAATRITNSYFADFKLVGQDSQAIAGWNGPGPYLIENNYLEAAGENLLFGGADASIPNLVPADITVRGNHVSKPPDWRRERWSVKNLFELKNARRVLVEHNLFEHNWEAAQAGPAILFTPRNQDGRAPWSGVADVMFRGNVVRHVAAAINVLGYDDVHPTTQTTRISIHHNLFAEVDASRWGGSGAFLLIGNGAREVSVDHNTVMQSGSVVATYGRPTHGFVFRNNLVRHNAYGIKGDGRATGQDTIAAFFPDAVITHNVFAGGPAAIYPSGNWFPPLTTWAAQFRDYAGADYVLAASSTYRHAGSDGEDVGADPEIVAAALQAESGRGRR